MKKIVLTTTGLLAATAFTTAASAQDYTLRVSHQLPPAHHIAVLVDEWAADVEERTDGAVDVQIFGANQAFPPGDNFQAVATGQIEAALSVNFQWAGSVPAMNVTVIPYLFTDLSRIEAFPASEAAEYLEELLDEVGVHNIAWFYTTRQSIFTSNGAPLIDVADFEGVKIRGLNRIADAGLVAVGAATVAMPGSEVYQALQTGVIDAGLTDVSAAWSRRYYEVQEFGTIAPFFSVYFHMYVNPEWWADLPEDIRQAITDASEAAEIAAIGVTEAEAAAATEELRNVGMTLHMQSEEEAEAWGEAMVGPVTDAFLEEAGETGQRIIHLLSEL